jgi:hypothetical protein
MEREDFEAIRFDVPATLLCAIEHGCAPGEEARYHFGRLGDAVRFACRTLPSPARRSAWIVVDNGLLAPEDLPKLYDRLAA